MGLYITVKDQDGKELGGFGPGERDKYFQLMKNGVNGCTCSGKMCTCYDYDDYIVTREQARDYDLLEEYFKDRDTVLLEFSY